MVTSGAYSSRHSFYELIDQLRCTHENKRLKQEIPDAPKPIELMERRCMSEK
jgi:hypothetical protein